MFGNQFASVVEWDEQDLSQIFYKFSNKELKKDSRLIIKPGQDAIFLYNGRIEGVFTDEGNYTISSDIIPFLSTLKGFKFGFNSGLRAEVVFVNTKELEIKWGTKSPINIPSDKLPGGIPIRANGTLHFKVKDYINLIDTLAGIRTEYYIDDVKQRITAILDQLLMKWISKEGKDLFNLQLNSFDIAKGIQEDLDVIMLKDGITITRFNVMSFNYPQEIQEMINKVASQSFINNMDTYTQTAVADSMTKSNGSNDAVSLAMGMKMAEKIMTSSNESTTSSSNTKFCSECGNKIDVNSKFCSHCGTKVAFN